MYNAVILVVDDEQTYLDSITDILKGKNFKIIQALNGKMGIEVTKKFKPDMIIADWEMPEMNGLKMIQELKSDETTKDIPVIMCTGIMTTSENLDTALEAGAADYIRKPIDAIELTARINAALSLSDAFKRIKAQNEELILLNSTKNKFFSIISHDLRGSFGAIMLLSDMLCENLKSYNAEEIEDHLKLICNSSKSVYNLVENLLDWSRSQMNKIEYIPEEIDFEQTINEVIEVLGPQAKNKSITLTSNINSSKQLITDKNILKTVLRNLISNAIKFTQPSGNISIQVISNELDIVFSVIDNGIGIKEEVINRLFKINEKVITRGTANETGTGLGLLLCKEFVDKLGGRIWVESREEKGSTFKFTIPLKID